MDHVMQAVDPFVSFAQELFIEQELAFKFVQCRELFV